MLSGLSGVDLAEVTPDGLRGAVGRVRAELVRVHQASPATGGRAEAALAASQPIGRMGTPQEVEAGWLTGLICQRSA
jgi:hypothetical protein